MESEALKALVIDALDDIKGQDIVALDVQKQTDIADHMVVASGNTSRQIKALVDNVLQKAKAEGVEVLGVEGEDSGEWILVDLADVIVHVMLPAVREFYDLERLWSVSPSDENAE
ncbi:MAG: ribosome silencing factor [Pseudomonadales bacterium]|nr:ribosome silencing factor [Pseudomonadales bacterium]MBO6565111.1 ribosome silencing factor [Pseudomonadales bacterium]MBO6597538.1 ribosome silencing factor [Pseudomonadales bacterium]MBO6657023.1 ribosome silencing factor [Pseudomonadales bacterium]MBO6704259.1 ribosome silencing factor [Pseudomonadales bacterium]